jgi:hypothetical protein
MGDEIEHEIQILQMAVTLEPSLVTDRTVRNCLRRLHNLQIERPEGFSPERLAQIEACRIRWEAACTPERIPPFTPDAPSEGQADTSNVCQHCGRRAAELKPFTYRSCSHVGHPIYGPALTFSQTSMLCSECFAAATRFSVTRFLSEHPWIVVIVLVMVVSAVVGWLSGPVNTKPKGDFKSRHIELKRKDIEFLDRMARERRQRDREFKEQQEREKENKKTPAERQKDLEDLLKKAGKENK